jgi:hypothetical protein
MEQFETIASILLPFANEIANVLTSSKIKLRGNEYFRNLYQDIPKTKIQKFSHILIDFIALSGIILSAVKAAEKHGKRAGIIKGVGVLIIAYIIPNLTIHTFMNKLCYRCSPSQKIFIGLLLVAGLTLFEYIFDHYIVESKWVKEKQE